MYGYNDEDGGIQFDPYDYEVIKNYLIPKLEDKPCREITTKDVYSKEPWLLDHPMGSFFKKNEWYYFVKRTQVSKKNIGRGRKVKRRITRDNDSGYWKANAKDYITDEKTKKVIGEKQSLSFVKSNVNNKKQKRGEGTSCDDVVVRGSESSWIMTEYMLPEEEGKFHELVICKIHEVKSSKKKDDDEASTSSYQLHHIDSSPSGQQPMDLYHESVSLEQQPSNIICKIQETKEEDHEPLIPHHHEFLADYSTKQQTVNEAHGHVQETPLIGLAEKNNQVFEASRQVSEKDEQLHNNDGPLVCIGSEHEAEGQDGGGDWLQEYNNMLMLGDESGVPMEEDDDILNYNTSFIDQDLLDQYATLRPQGSSKL